MEVAELKSSMQAAINSGGIGDRQQLLAKAASLGLTVTRNGRDYAGFLCPNGKRLRVHFEFNDRPPPSHRAPKPSKNDIGYWIYALLATSADRKRTACYVGQAANLTMRFREHQRRQREGRCSYALFQWAECEGVAIQAVVLTWAAGDQSNATSYEGYWLQLALKAGLEAPDVHKWGRLPKPGTLAGQPAHWPVEKVRIGSLVLGDVVDHGLMPNVICDVGQRHKSIGSQAHDRVV